MIPDYNKYIHSQSDGANALLQIEKEVSVNNAGLLKAEMEKALHSNDTIFLKLTGIETMDIAAVQLIKAFSVEAKSRNKKINYEITCTENVKKLLSYAGLAKFTMDETI